MLPSFKLQISDAVAFVLQKYVDLKVHHEKEDLNGHQLVQSVSSRSIIITRLGVSLRLTHKILPEYTQKREVVLR